MAKTTLTFVDHENGKVEVLIDPPPLTIVTRAATSAGQDATTGEMLAIAAYRFAMTFNKHAERAGGSIQIASRLPSNIIV